MNVPARIPDYCSAETLAARLDCGTTKIRDMVQKGELPPPRRFSGLVRWKWADVERHLDGASDPDEGDPIMSAASG